jgi:hypothetical protein
MRNAFDGDLLSFCRFAVILSALPVNLALRAATDAALSFS